jgi:hypothetical protein
MTNFLEAMRPTKVAAFLLPLLFLSGCLSLEKLTGYLRQDACYTHTVRWPGENLYVISKWYTGNGENWKILARANPGLDPDRIRVGETIRVPEHIMQTKKPLPQEFIQSRTEKQAGRIQSEPREEPPRLFGPKPYPSR